MNILPLKKWFVAGILVCGLIPWLIWAWAGSRPEVESYRATEVAVGAQEQIDREGVSFPMVFANAVPSPFSIEVELNGARSGRRALWVLASQADNHGELTVTCRGRVIGTVDNRLVESTRLPVPKLSRVGLLDVTDSKLRLQITSRNERVERHYMELGQLVLAPEGRSADEIVALLSSRHPAPFADFGLSLLFLGLAFVVLYLASRTETAPTGRWLGNCTIIGMLAVVFVFGLLACRSGVQTTAAGTGGRTGLEQKVDGWVVHLGEMLKQWQGQVLPNREKIDSPAASEEQGRGTLTTEIYRSVQASDHIRVSSLLFGGRLYAMQVMSHESFARLATWWIVAIAAVIALDRWGRTRITIVLALAVIAAFSVTLSLRLSEGWDEFFINLRHAYMFVEQGVYSINAHMMCEATVDFLSLFATAIMGWCGLRLENGFILMSISGNVVVTVFAFLIVCRLTGDRTWGFLGAVALGLYPNVLWVGGSGFTAVFFCGWILASSYFLLFTRHRKFGLVMLSGLTLVRTEGILFAAIILGIINVLGPLGAVWRTRAWKEYFDRAALEGVVVASPFLISLVVRKLAFGHALPTPITFKNTSFDSSYVAAGIDRFIDLLSGHDLHMLLVAILLLGGAAFCHPKRAEWFKRMAPLLMLNMASFLFILPYFIGGGDWFPAVWNRYGLPWNLTLCLTAIVLLHGAVEALPRTWLRPVAASLFVFACGAAYLSSSAQREGNFLTRTLTALRTADPYRWRRVDDLASLGFFLKDVLPPDAVVSSPEEATIMYYSQREMIGLLGVSTPEIAAMPLQPKSPGEPGHRRRAHTVIYHKRPDVIALYEPVTTGDFRGEADFVARMEHALKERMFGQYMVDIAYYRVGSFEALEAMGYRHMTICLSDRIFSLFVSSRIHGYVVANLSSRGFVPIGRGSVPYAVTPALLEKYEPAAKELARKL